jgi:hypothetical protein
MPPSRQTLELDAGRIFRWSFVLILLIYAWGLWRRVPWRRVRRPGERLLIFLLAPWGMRRAAIAALIVSSAVTIGAMLFVRLVVAPLLNLWLRPAYDPSAWSFHLSAGESPETWVPTRFQTRAGWRPGALVLTARRIWFMPAAWDAEPWSMPRQELVRIEARPPAFARFLPLRHWPDRLRFTDRAGDQAAFAMADPDAVLSWLAPSRNGDAAPPRPRVVPEGAFDA